VKHRKIIHFIAVLKKKKDSNLKQKFIFGSLKKFQDGSDDKGTAAGKPDPVHVC
jgi:hypothetical protein